MMTPELMSIAGRSYNPKFLEFTRIYSKKPRCLICFFEGDDAKYYGIRIRENLHETDYEGIICDGKSGVIVVSLLNAWMMLVRHKGMALKFNDIKLKTFISINIDKVSEEQPTLNYLNKLFVAHGISESEITQQINLFIPEDRDKIFRGKFEIEFLIGFLTKLKDDLCLASPKHFPKKRKISFALPSSRDDILSEFSQYADTPECLREYLKKFKD